MVEPLIWASRASLNNLSTERLYQSDLVDAVMKHLRFSAAEYSGEREQTVREVSLAEMHRAVPWARLEGLIAPRFPKAEAVGRIH